MTTAFYAPPSSFRGDRVILPDDEARHASKVLRKGAGDTIVVVDGEGGWHRVQLDHVSRSKVVGTRVETRREVGEMDVPLTLGVGLVKNRNRFETLVEKAVELGATEIVPLTTERTEKESLRENRIRNLLIAAMKQCGRTRLPAVPAPRPLPAVLEEERNGLSFVCHEEIGAEGPLLSALTGAPPEAVTLLVGPEGGFTDGEVSRAADAGFRPVSLGRRRLRTETAGIAAAATVSLWIDSRSAASRGPDATAA
jgi:16S rRNA (uracil1498-N3)-methyltransferase